MKGHATVQTKSGNFVIIDKNQVPVTRPYLNFCSLEYRQEKKSYYQTEKLQEFYEKLFEKGMFEGYDRGHDLSLSDPIAVAILNSGVLNA